MIAGILSCFNRIIITGTLPRIYFAQGMTTWLYGQAIRLVDYPKFADSLRQKIRENAERLAKENHIKIEHINKKNLRKKGRVQKIFYILTSFAL